MGAVLARLRALGRDESGQSLVFGVITIFLVLFFGAMVMGVGRVCARRIQVQFAADAAAHSSSLVESQCLNSISLLNTAMAQVRGRAMRYAADVNSYGVLAELRDRVMELNSRIGQGLAHRITHVQTRVADLQQQIDAEANPDLRRELERRMAHLQRELEYLTDWLVSLHRDSDLDQPLLPVDDEAFWQQQIAALERALSALELALADETDPDLRDELQRQIDELTAQLGYAVSLRNGLHEDGDPSAPLLAEAGRDPLWIQEIVGLDRPELEYAEAYGRAETWIPAANQWVRDMSRLEYTIAILAPNLAAETAYRVGVANGAEYGSLFPCSRWAPREEAYLFLDVYHPGDQWWRVVGGGVALEVQTVGCEDCGGGKQCGECVNCWLVSWTKGLTEQGRYRICQLEEKRWFIHNILTDDMSCVQQVEKVYFVETGQGAPPGVDVVVHKDHDPPWMELVNTNGAWPRNTLFVRVLGGVVQQAAYRWDDGAQQWVMPQEGDFVALPATEVTLDGVRVSVSLDAVIPLPHGGGYIYVLEPAYVELLDADQRRWGRVYMREPPAFWAVINTVQIWVEQEDFHLQKRGQTIWRAGANGVWRANFDRDEEYWWQHRLTPLSASHWHYEYMELGARMAPESNMARLMAHRDVDVEDLPGGGLSCAACLPAWAYDGELNPEGWLDPASGSLVRTAPEEPLENDYRYFQVRPSWDPWDTAFGTREPDGLWEFDFDHDGRIGPGETMTSPTCGGTGQVMIEPHHVFGRLGGSLRGATNPRRPTVSPDDYQEAAFDLARLPLVLSEEFFKYGSTVGAWHRRESHFPRREDGTPASSADLPERPVEYLLHDPYPGMKGLFRGPRDRTARQRGEILRPAWGYFAVAAARPRLSCPGEDAGALEAGVYFSDTAERQLWVERHLSNLYTRRCADGWSYWDARLVALSRQVLDEDVQLGLPSAGETGVGWLMKRIAYGSPGGWAPGEHGYGEASGWVSDIYGSFDATYPPRRVMRDLTAGLRPRAPYPSMGRPYYDERGLLRDPFAEYLGGREQGSPPRGEQLNYHQLDEDSILH